MSAAALRQGSYHAPTKELNHVLDVVKKGTQTEARQARNIIEHKTHVLGVDELESFGGGQVGGGRLGRFGLLRILTCEQQYSTSVWTAPFARGAHQSSHAQTFATRMHDQHAKIEDPSPCLLPRVSCPAHARRARPGWSSDC